MKRILGLDLGTNSIGWALVNIDANGNPIHIEGMGSRIIPMGSEKIDYEKGATISKNADRREKRQTRRMGKRYKLRRNKLIYVLAKLNMLPDQFQLKSDFPDANRIQDIELLPIIRGTEQRDSLEHYELRAKALHNKIELKQLGSILYQYNRLRGYSGGGYADENKKEKKNDDEEEKSKYEVYTKTITLVKVEKSDSTFRVRSGNNKGSELPLYNVTVFDEGQELCGITELQNLQDKINSEIELEIRIKRNKTGEKVTFALPQKTNWRRQMEETEKLLKEKGYFPCQLFVEELRQNKWSKIRNRVFLRQQFTKEFDAVWEEQSKYYPILCNCPTQILSDIVNYIFPGQSDSQKKLRKEGIEKGLKYIIKEQIIYYQRPLKRQTQLIRKCQFEKDETVIPVTHPLFQEFRCWDQINRLFVTSKQDVWNEKKKKFILKYKRRYLTDEQKTTIYNKLLKQKQLSFNEVAKIIKLNTDISEYLNGLQVKSKLKGCDTIIDIQKIIGDTNLNTTTIEAIWQAIFENAHEGSEYDEHSKRVQSIVAVLPKHIIEESKRIELALLLAQKIRYPRQYASLSEKAIKNILPLMRLNPEKISDEAKNKYAKIKHLIDTGEIIDEELPQDYIVDFVKDNPCAIEHGGLMYAFASSLVYGRHTSEEIKPQLTNYHEIEYIERNLRNPIVEQISNETMQVIKSLWKTYHLNPNELEIRVELARDLKNSAAEREKIAKGQRKNKVINERIKNRLVELHKEINDRNIELYKLWSRQGIEDQPKIKDPNNPTHEEIEKMRIWEEQKFIDPYTLKPIPLSKLFTREYDIDHIIPKSRYFDNSMANKVVCKSTVNEEKDNRTAWEYISQQNSNLNICSISDYLEHVNKFFYGKKKKNLLAEKIPSDSVKRQLKDTQYLTIAIKNELAKIVGSDKVKTTTGSVTDYLRSQWGLKEMFMKLTEHRFKQMEFRDLDENGNIREEWIQNYFDKEKNKHVYEIKGWSKRYDQRHHAIDALVVALCNERYIKRLNDLNTYFQDELAKHNDDIPFQDEDSIEEAFFKLEKVKRNMIMKEIDSSRKFASPMPHLVSEAKEILETMIVSQKPKDKLATKEDAKGHIQLKIRAALHQETYYGKTNNRDTKTKHISELSAKDINKIIDEILKKEIEIHRKKYKTIKEAFTGEGLVSFNELRKLAKKPPVYKVKLWYNVKENKESELQQLYPDNSKKSVITGDNYMFIVMESKGKRIFDITTLFDSAALAKECIKNKQYNIEAIKNQICENIRLVERKDKKNRILPKPEKVLFYLQQNDLVYMPKYEDDEVVRMNASELKEYLRDSNNKKEFVKQIYKVVKFTGTDCFFIPNTYAKEISIPKNLSPDERKELELKYHDKKIPKQELNNIEFGSYFNCTLSDINNKNRKIQEYCIKMKTDWLGNLIEFNGLTL